MSYKILILEDNTERIKLFKKNLIGHDVKTTEFVDECKQYLTEYKFDFIFLDHDLGGKTFVESGGSEPTGYDIASWIVTDLKEENYPIAVLIHSLNPYGAQKMFDEIEKIDVFRGVTPFVWQNENLSDLLDGIKKTN